jgi:hypothetical protein
VSILLPGDISQLSQSYETDGHPSALGSPHHLHSAESRVFSLGDDLRWVLSESAGLGVRSDLDNSTDDRGSTVSH